MRSFWLYVKRPVGRTVPTNTLDGPREIANALIEHGLVPGSLHRIWPFSGWPVTRPYSAANEGYL